MVYFVSDIDAVLTAQSSKRQFVQCKGYEMRGSAHTSSCVLAGKNGRPLLESEIYKINIFTENIFTTPKIIFSTWIMRETDNF